MTRCKHGCRYPCGECAGQTTREAQRGVEREWFESTRHCGGCGQPGTFCQCTPRNPCGCRDLHEMGSGIGVDAADVFADGAPVVVEQEGLFG